VSSQVVKSAHAGIKLNSIPCALDGPSSVEKWGRDFLALLRRHLPAAVTEREVPHGAKRGPLLLSNSKRAVSPDSGP
jgi:hypothetical protein